MLTNMRMSITPTFMMSITTMSTTNTTIQRKIALMEVWKTNGITIPCTTMGRNPKKILLNRLKERKMITLSNGESLLREEDEDGTIHSDGYDQ
jgi:hypothetical protein